MKLFARILSAFVTFVTGLSFGAAAVFSYAGYVHHNTDPGLTAIVWGIVMLYAGICAATARDIWR